MGLPHIAEFAADYRHLMYLTHKSQRNSPRVAWVGGSGARGCHSQIPATAKVGKRSKTRYIIRSMGCGWSPAARGSINASKPVSVAPQPRWTVHRNPLKRREIRWQYHPLPPLGLCALIMNNSPPTNKKDCGDLTFCIKTRGIAKGLGCLGCNYSRD
jgi:hypothetical protein